LKTRTRGVCLGMETLLYGQDREFLVGCADACSSAGIPAHMGMAYVFVQHLNPRRGSLLVNILSKRATFSVEEARTGVKVRPDHLYVIAPNTTLTISGDVLHLRSRDPADQPHHPVDMLFHSLAEQRGSRVRRSKRNSSDQTGRWNHFRAG
jgi:hypothetical protein